MITTQLAVDLNHPFHSKKNISKTPNSPQFLSIHLDIYIYVVIVESLPLFFRKKNFPKTVLSRC